jgi:hypothetical protein
MLNIRIRARQKEAVHLRRHMPGKRRKPR